MANANYDYLIWNHKGFPKKTTEDEDIILVIRQDVITLILKGFVLYILFLFLFITRIIFVASSSFFWSSLFDTFLYAIATILAIIFLIMFHNYYLSMQIVTSYRIIDIDQTGLFDREVNSTILENIEDMTIKKRNILNLIFDFGDIVIQTSGRTGGEYLEKNINGFVFNDIPNPSEVGNILDILKRKNEQKDSIKSAKSSADALQQLLAKRTLN